MARFGSKIADVSGDHCFLIRLERATANAAPCRRNHGLVGVIESRVESDPKEPQFLANARSDFRGVLADSTGKNEQIHSTEGGRIRTNEFSYLVTEDIHCFSSGSIPMATGTQLSHLSARSGYPEHASP